MPLENVGKVTKVEIKKDNVIVYFNNFKEISLSKDTYTNHFLYVGKEINEKTYKELISENKINKLINYILNIIAKKAYTEKEIKSKLENRNASSSECTAVIKYLKQHGLIDDEKYAAEYTNYLNEKHYGKYYIINKLKEKGIASFYISKINFDEDIEKEKLEFNFNLLKEKYKNKSYKVQSELIFYKLNQLGFASDDINDMIKRMMDYSVKQELINLKREIETRKYKQDKNKLITSLLRKGYNYELIKYVLKGED